MGELGVWGWAVDSCLSAVRRSARTVVLRAQSLGVDMPIAQGVVAMLDDQMQSAQAVAVLWGVWEGRFRWNSGAYPREMRVICSYIGSTWGFGSSQKIARSTTRERQG